MAVFGLAAELTNWKRKGNTLGCVSKSVLLSVVGFVSKMVKNIKFCSKQNVGWCWRYLSDFGCWLKENKGNKGLISQKYWMGGSPPPDSHPAHSFPS